MFAAEARGELPKGTAREWAHATPDIKKLPERVRKKKRKQGQKEALAKFGLDEHATYSGPPAFTPMDTHSPVTSEAGKQLDERRDDRRTDLKDAPAGFAILGNKTAAMTPAFIRSIARDADIEVGQPEFKEKVRGLTGKVKLEELSSGELQQVAKMIWQKEAAEKKKQTGTDKIVAMTSGPGVAGAVTPIVANTVAYMAARETPRSKKHDFSRPKAFRKLTKRMDTGDVPKFRASSAGMGHAKVTVEETAPATTADPKKATKPKTEKRWVVGLPAGVSEATAAHELGHVRNWQAVEEAVGAKNARKLMGHLGKVHNVSTLTSPLASAYTAIDDDMSWAPGLAQLAVSSPRLLDEALASGHALRHLIGRHGVLPGLREGATLLPAFGTYAALAGAPLAITGARRLWRRYHPDGE